MDRSTLTTITFDESMHLDLAPERGNLRQLLVDMRLLRRVLKRNALVCGQRAAAVRVRGVHVRGNQRHGLACVESECERAGRNGSTQNGDQPRAKKKKTTGESRFAWALHFLSRPGPPRPGSQLLSDCTNLVRQKACGKYALFSIQHCRSIKKIVYVRLPYHENHCSSKRRHRYCTWQRHCRSISSSSVDANGTNKCELASFRKPSPRQTCKY